MNVALSEILSDLETLETEQDFTRKFEKSKAWVQQIYLSRAV